jgi:cytochrome c peroxidase
MRFEVVGHWLRRRGASSWLIAIGMLAFASAIAAAAIPNLFSFADSTGEIATYNTVGSLDTTNPFFQSLGTNGRSCATCHIASNALSLTATEAQARFVSTGGTDPLFAAVDGANCPEAAPGDASAHSLLLNNGLIRIFRPIPSNAQYTVQTVYDPYGCADRIDPSTGQRVLSVYRRPLPDANLRFLSAVMFDGRETFAPLNNASTFQANLVTDLTHQVTDAILGHAQAAVAPTSQQVSAIVNFELTLFTAQRTDNAAGSLQAQGASGGPRPIASQTYYPGINDSLGSNPTGAAFNNQAFTIYAPWADLHSGKHDPYTAARETIAAGEAIFNGFPLTITKVSGLNDALNQPTITGTCTTCHDTPNVGNHSLPVPLDIGVSHPPSFELDSHIQAALAQLSVPDLPIFKVTCPSGTVFTTDLGKALISGLCADLTRGKGPILRGLAARAPYFHNGAAATLQEVVNFYNERFQMALTNEQKEQLIAFLQAL